MAILGMLSTCDRSRMDISAVVDWETLFDYGADQLIIGTRPVTAILRLASLLRLSPSITFHSGSLSCEEVSLVPESSQAGQRELIRTSLNFVFGHCSGPPRLIRRLAKG